VPFTAPLGPVVDPDWGLFHLHRALWDPVDPTRVGSLSPDLQVRVNGEVYRFADQRTLARFLKTPQLWCGLLRDPVSGRRFWPSTRSPEAWWFGGPYYFEDDSTKARFVDDPKRWQVIRRM
jgi:YHS domain-containing protein